MYGYHYSMHHPSLTLQRKNIESDTLSEVNLVKKFFNCMVGLLYYYYIFSVSLLRIRHKFKYHLCYFPIDLCVAHHLHVFGSSQEKIEPGRVNPYKLVYRVTKFACQHRIPGLFISS